LTFTIEQQAAYAKLRRLRNKILSLVTAFSICSKRDECEMPQQHKCVDVSRNYMRRLLILLLVTILSCQTSRKKNKDSNPPPKDPGKSYLPQSVQNYLTQELPGWKLALKENWEDTIFKKYQTDSSQMNYILEDFNCDNKLDFAAILKDSIGNFAAFEVYSSGRHYLHNKLEDYGVKKMLDFGIQFLKPGTTFQRYDGSLQTFDCGAIEIFFTNRNSKKIFYSDSKGASFVIQKGE
jgi:hypothetical protein